jgi:acetoin utilization protein AcuB
MAVERYMTVKPITVRSEDSIWHALKILRTHQIRHLPVVQGKRLVGMLSDRDVRLLLPSSLAVPEEQERFRAWGAQVKVGDVMTRKVFTITPKTPTEKAAQLMVKHRIGCLPVLRGSTLVGIISTIDLLRATILKYPSQIVSSTKTAAHPQKSPKHRRVRQGERKKVRRP